MMLLAITLFLLVKEAKMRTQKGSSVRLSFLLGFFIFLTSIEKESFVIMIPAYILLSVAFAMDADIVGGRRFRKTQYSVFL